MRTGVLSDEYIRSANPAFFPQPKARKGRRASRPFQVPFYDLYQVAQVTMQNPYDGAAELVKNYRPSEPALPSLYQVLQSPVPQRYDSAGVADTSYRPLFRSPVTPRTAREPFDDEDVKAPFDDDDESGWSSSDMRTPTERDEVVQTV